MDMAHSLSVYSMGSHIVYKPFFINNSRFKNQFTGIIFGMIFLAGDVYGIFIRLHRSVDF